MRSSRACITILKRSYSNGVGPTKATTSAQHQPAVNVQGLTSNCVKPASGPVGPGAASNAEYKVPEYFCFNRFSYAEAEVEMAKYRCPQPSALKK